MGRLRGCSVRPSRPAASAVNGRERCARELRVPILPMPRQLVNSMDHGRASKTPVHTRDIGLTDEIPLGQSCSPLPTRGSSIPRGDDLNGCGLGPPGALFIQIRKMHDPAPTSPTLSRSDRALGTERFR